jgi:hypothetical protein
VILAANLRIADAGRDLGREDILKYFDDTLGADP